MASQKKKHVINELLAFIQNALKDDDLDHYSIVKTCENNFKTEEINKAKRLLLQLLGKTEQKQSIQECSQNLLDIIDLFEKTAVNNTPAFLAKQLNKLPLVLLERPSIQKLTMEIRFLKASLVEIQSKVLAASNNVNELWEQVYAMRRAELEQCWSQDVSKDTNEVKSASNDTKFDDETPRPAPRTSIGKASSRASLQTPRAPNVTAVQPGCFSMESDGVDLSKLNLEVDKDGFVKVKTKGETKS